MNKQQVKFNAEIENYTRNWTPEKVAAFRSDFLSWYDEEKRMLPWRINQEPYSVWVSEIMLQQTQVATVIPYYERFLEWFPTVEDLAYAPEDKLLKAWEGLGYYSRVRNMQVAARQVVEDFGGEFPTTAEGLKLLKGIGPYTAGAIASISFKQAAPAVDGNVMRVFSRLFGIGEDIVKPSTLKYFDAVVRHVIDPERPGDMNQATMDLGSSICTPTKPQCEDCPLQSYCLTYQQGTQANYPVKLKKIKVTHKYYLALAKENTEGLFEMIQRPSEGLLANLWTFPLVEVSESEYNTYHNEWQTSESDDTRLQNESLLTKVQAEMPEVVWQKQPVGEITHVFSHLKWHVLIVYGHQRASVIQETNERQLWLAPDRFKELALPKPQEKINQVLKKARYLD
ncbi:A/G-specific adenine glycosylase [Vagococcus zengguangii]|uniref:A/G-specific adenine glycosylase n=1 Tax=Vagococcus zengguangii TaxID=2571750 RepID=UPI0011089B46|nr:A/G-specific adenine glycosylase [Vagococcus zengguangii]TLG81051.1 A/G-specific adenine glycosylase [Vagococcus zengguangii]